MKHNSNPHDTAAKSPRRRGLAYTAVAVGTAVLLLLLWKPIVAWFTGKPMGGGSSETVSSRAGSLTGEASLAPRDLPDASLAPLKTAFTAYEEARALLAEDRLDGLQARAGRLARSLAEAKQTFANGDQDVLQWLEQGERAAARLAAASKLEEARQAFSDVSRILVGLARCDPRLAQGLHLFSCPMTSGFNQWMQRSPGAENPYMGTAMQSCGSAMEWNSFSTAESSQAQGAEISHYTCSMHPSVHKEGPGTCPICNMDLVPVTQEQAAGGGVVITPEQQQLIGVRTGLVDRRPIESEIRAVGRVAFDETRFEDVTVKYGGYIGRLYVEETGQPVRKGQTLFTLYSPDLYAAQQEYLVALASQRTAQTSAVPDRADYLVRAARQKLRLWDVSDSQVRELASSGKPSRELAVPSPASGYVVEKAVVEGAAVQPGMRLYRLAALDRVWVEAEVYESELPRVRIGQRTTVTLPYLPGQEFHGRVSRVLPTLNPESRTGRVRIELANRSGAAGPTLRPDMYADVALESEGRETLMVPESAVLYTGPRRLVFLDTGNGRFQQREVRLGARSGDFYEVLAGLQEGDRVVTSGNFLVDAEARLRSGGDTGGGEHAGH